MSSDITYDDIVYDRVDFERIIDIIHFTAIVFKVFKFNHNVSLLLRAYNWDRFFDYDDSFSPRASSNANQRRLESGTSEVQRFMRPSMDLHEDSGRNAVTATFELPGITKEDVQIDVHNGRMTVSADSKISEEHTREGYAVRERRFGRFSRT